MRDALIYDLSGEQDSSIMSPPLDCIHYLGEGRNTDAVPRRSRPSPARNPQSGFELSYLWAMYGVDAIED